MEGDCWAFIFRFCFLVVFWFCRQRCIVCPTDVAVGVGDICGLLVFVIRCAEFVGVVDRPGFHIFEILGVFKVDVRGNCGDSGDHG